MHLIDVCTRCRCLTEAGVGLSHLYHQYSSNSCQPGHTLIVTTLSWGVVATVISMLNSVGAGLLPPSMILAYSTLLCWHYLPLQSSSGCAQAGEHAVTESTKVKCITLTLICVHCTLVKPVAHALFTTSVHCAHWHSALHCD
jgi:Serine incorporator (Serinc)